MTTDTKPTPLPAARLAEIREALAAFEACPVASALQDDAAYDCARALGEVLAHLDALTAPPGDGEQRFLAVFAEQQGFTEDEAAEAWSALSPASRAENVRIGLALDAHGYARGRAEGEAERARMTDKFKAIADNLRHMFGVADGQAAENARLTAELAEARAAEARSVDALNAAIRMHHEGVEERAEAESAARREGAREEREAAMAIIKRAKDAPTTREAWLVFAELEARNDAAPVEGEDGAT